MKKTYQKLGLVLCIALACCFFPKMATAATTAKKTTTKSVTVYPVYINSDGQPVVCYAKGTKGSYKLTNDKGTKVASGKFSSTTKLTIKKTLSTGKKYYLTVTGIDEKLAMKRGSALKAKELTCADNSLKGKVDLPDKFDGWILGTYHSKNKLAKAAYTTKSSQSLAMGTAMAGSYNVIVIAATKDKEDSVIYGRGTVKSFSYQPAMTGFTAAGQIGKATASWGKPYADGVRVRYKADGGKYIYKNIDTKDGTVKSYTVKKLKTGKYYYFSVRPFYYGKDGKRVYTNGEYTAEKKVRIYNEPGKVPSTRFNVDNHGELFIQWEKAKGATDYSVYYKVGSGKYKKAGDRKGTKCSLKDVPQKKKITVIVYACKNGDRGSKHSDPKSVTPATWLNKYGKERMAKRVKNIAYKNGKCIIDTTMSYTNEVIEAYCNYYTSHNSTTGYLIFVSLYTQQGAVLKGKKGHWKIYTKLTLPGCKKGRFNCSGGSYENRTRRGLNKIFLKEKRWEHPSTSSWYISHFWNKCSIHSFPCWNKKIQKGKTHPPYQDARIRKPVSTACVRVSYELAKWIWENVPKNTQVRCK